MLKSFALLEKRRIHKTRLYLSHNLIVYVIDGDITVMKNKHWVGILSFIIK